MRVSYHEYLDVLQVITLGSVSARVLMGLKNDRRWKIFWGFELQITLEI